MQIPVWSSLLTQPHYSQENKSVNNFWLQHRFVAGHYVATSAECPQGFPQVWGHWFSSALAHQGNTKSGNICCTTLSCRWLSGRSDAQYVKLHSTTWTTSQWRCLISLNSFSTLSGNLLSCSAISIWRKCLQPGSMHQGSGASITSLKLFLSTNWK